MYGGEDIDPPFDMKYCFLSLMPMRLNLWNDTIIMCRNGHSQNHGGALCVPFLPLHPLSNF